MIPQLLPVIVFVIFTSRNILCFYLWLLHMWLVWCEKNFHCSFAEFNHFNAAEEPLHISAKKCESFQNWRASIKQI